MTTEQPPKVFDYAPWRHGGWYVRNVRHPSGAVGCVSRNYADRKWRIVCDTRPFDQRPTFKSRDDAARAEWLLANGTPARPIIITIKGGMVDGVHNLPPGSSLVVMDFDVENTLYSSSADVPRAYLDCDDTRFTVSVHDGKDANLSPADATKHIGETFGYEVRPDTNDDGCPKDDPDCEGDNGDNHDACESPADPSLGGTLARDPAA